MKKPITAILMLLVLAAPAGAHELSDKMLQLFKDPSRNVSLGAMLIAGPVSDNEAMVAYARRALKKSDPVVDAMVKRYYLASATFEKADVLAFIRGWPENPDEFKEVLAFDAALTRTVSGVMVLHLVQLTGCDYPREIYEAARDKVSRLGMVQLLSGWAAEIFPNGDFPACKGR